MRNQPASVRSPLRRHTVEQRKQVISDEAAVDSRFGDDSESATEVAGSSPSRLDSRYRATRFLLCS